MLRTQPQQNIFLSGTNLKLRTRWKRTNNDQNRKKRKQAKRRLSNFFTRSWRRVAILSSRLQHPSPSNGVRLLPTGRRPSSIAKATPHLPCGLSLPGKYGCPSFSILFCRGPCTLGRGSACTDGRLVHTQTPLSSAPSQRRVRPWIFRGRATRGRSLPRLFLPVPVVLPRTVLSTVLSGSTGRGCEVGLRRRLPQLTSLYQFWECFVLLALLTGGIASTIC